jgi:nitrite reductase/ring-hydroxylating ferredoxin subunit
MSVMTVGGYLGGHLSYARGVGVNRLAGEDRPSDWTALDDAPPVLVYGDHAIAATCTHAGGDLRKGAIDEDACTVTCPLHESVFRLDTGEVVHGPATTPQPVYDVREIEGRVEVRSRA